MNFKPTKWKIIGSVILGILLVLIGSLLIICLTFGCYGFGFGGIFEPYPLYLMAGLIIIIYVIWSLIQKKEKLGLRMP